jgi:hypothetical protein
MLEVARNVLAHRMYGVITASATGDHGRAYRRLDRAIDEAVDRTRASDPTHPGWHVVRMERDRLTEVVWPYPSDDDGDGEDSLVPRRPRRPPGSGAIALPFP